MSAKLGSLRLIFKNLSDLKIGSNEKLINNALMPQILTSKSLCFPTISRQFHVNSPRSREKVTDDRRKMIASLPRKDEGTEGEQAVGVDSIKSREDMFMNEDTPNMLFNGIPFKDVPICNIRVSPNNTIISLSDAKSGEVKLIRSCGIEGFKNTRKGTNVAAQATAISFSSLALSKGYKTIKVNVRGLGPGRMSAIKGLTMGGLEVISVTDTTPVSENPPRPPRPKSL